MLPEPFDNGRHPSNLYGRVLENKVREVLVSFVEQNEGGEYYIGFEYSAIDRLQVLFMWTGFAGMEVTKRQTEVWKHLRQNLSDEQRKQLAVVYCDEG